MQISFFYKLLLGFSLTILAFGCEQIISIDDPQYEAPLVVYGVLGPNELPQVFFTQGKDLSGWIEQVQATVYPENLEPWITTGSSSQLLQGEWRDTLVNITFPPGQDMSPYLIYEGEQALPDTGLYQLQLSWQGQTVSAQTRVPQKVAIRSAEQQTEERFDISGNWTTKRIRVFFNDNPQGAQGYRLKYGYEGWGFWPRYDSVLQNYVNDSIYRRESAYSSSIDDEGKNGSPLQIDIFPQVKTYDQIEIQPDGRERGYTDIWLLLETQGPELANFLQSLEAQFFANGDPFVEPVFLKGNVEGGQGVFGAYNLSDTVWVRYYDN